MRRPALASALRRALTKLVVTELPSGANVSTVPFSQLLSERTRASHSASEHADFMDDLIKGRGSRDDYVALVAQHFFIYEALEAAATTLTDDPIAAAFIAPELTRLPALEHDLAFLIGKDWRERISPLPTTERYVRRITDIAAHWSGAFVAHHYTRYLGDLSGGQFIRTLMQRQFGFTDDGVSFYTFNEIVDPKEFKDSYRAALDRAPWTEAEKERVLDEVLIAYELNTELFNDLARAKAAV
jgi:heme oxygenase (biliverdin-producing, ferredoxin)